MTAPTRSTPKAQGTSKFATKKVAHPPSRVDQMMANGFAQRVERYRTTGQGVTVGEVPQVLDALLDLNSVELKEFVSKLGHIYSVLQDQKKVAKGPASAPQVVRILSGEVSGRGEKLPVTSGEALKMAKACGAEIQRLRQTPGTEAQIAHLEQRQALLADVGVKLTKLKDHSALGKVGVQAATSLNVRVFQPLDKTKLDGGLLNIAGLPPIAGKALDNVLRPSVAMQTGFKLGDKDRSGKRKVEHWKNVGAGSLIAGADYTWKKEGGGLGKTLSAPVVQLQYHQVRGKTLNITLPLIGSLMVGERYLGLGLFTPELARRLPLHIPGLSGFPMPGFPAARLLPSLDLGLCGDGVQYVTSPVIEMFDWWDHRRKERREKKAAAE